MLSIILCALWIIILRDCLLKVDTFPDMIGVIQVIGIVQLCDTTQIALCVLICTCQFIFFLYIYSEEQEEKGKGEFRVYFIFSYLICTVHQLSKVLNTTTRKASSASDPHS